MRRYRWAPEGEVAVVDKVRIHDVARRAGVSVTTVSHALSGRGKVSEATRERVRAAAADLGYAPNRIASALRRRRSDVIGFVTDEIATTPFAGRIVLGAQQAAAEAGMVLMLVNSGGDGRIEQTQLAALLAQQIDALVYATMFHRPVVAPAVPDGMPLVLVNAVDPARELPAVVPDEFRLGQDATRVLLDAGHRDVVHVTIDAPVPARQGRLAGYRAAMAEAGLPPRVVEVPGPGADAAAGRAAFTAVLEDGAPTAVFAFNDPMAMGVYQVAQQRGIEIPRELSVVGVDDLEIIAAQLVPGLTTLALPHEQMGRWAVEQAVRRLQPGQSAPGETLELVCRLVTRESVRAR